MRPRNELEREVDRLSAALRQDSLSDGQLRWLVAYKYGTVAAMYRGKFWCPNCGKYIGKTESDYENLIDRHEVTCPHCRSKLTTEHADTNYYPYRVPSKIKAKGIEYVLFCQRVGDFQVFRYFVVEYVSRLNKGIASVEYQEVVRTWSKKGCPLVTESVGYGGCGCWYWSHPYSRTAPLTLKTKQYKIFTDIVYPRSSFSEEYKRFCLSKIGRIVGVVAPWMVHDVLNDDHGLTICEHGWYNLLGCYVNSNADEKAMLWDAIKIAIRNGYDTADRNVPVWKDLVSTVAKLGLDRRNAFYVCPADLSEAHDRMIRRLKRKEENDMLREMSNVNKTYIERVSKFLDFSIPCGKLRIAVLPNVYEFKHEGDTLQHCVYHGAYFRKTRSLVMSARLDGVPVETIELSLDTFKILQCFGFKNSHTKYHDRIVSSVKSAVPALRKIAGVDIRKNNIRANVS